MGWFSYFPRLQCYQGISALNYWIDGKILIQNQEINFGSGYIEKTWGNEFPQKWIWIQSNHFQENHNSTIFAAIASVPIPSANQQWFNMTGFIFMLNIPSQNLQIRLATYTGARVQIDLCQLDKIYKSILYITKIQFTLLEKVINKEKVEIYLEDAQYKIYLTAIDRRDKSILLHQPIEGGQMIQRVNEMLNATIQVKVIDKSRQVEIFDDTGNFGGLEIELDGDEVF